MGSVELECWHRALPWAGPLQHQPDRATPSHLSWHRKTTASTQAPSTGIVPSARVNRLERNLLSYITHELLAFLSKCKSSFCSRGSNVFCFVGCSMFQQASEESSPRGPMCCTLCFWAQSSGVLWMSALFLLLSLQLGWPHWSHQSVSNMCYVFMCNAHLEAALVPPES